MGANAQTSVPTFTAGEVLTAANMNISARTGVPVFANTTTRDAGFGGTGEKTLAEGQLCYLEDSNVVQYYDGAAWATVGPAAAGGMTLVKAQTIGNAVSSVAVTSAFSSTYDNYLVTIQGGVADATRVLSLTLGATGGTAYRFAQIYTTYSTATVLQNASNGQASIDYVGYGTTDNIAGLIYIYGPNLAKTTGVIANGWAHTSGGNTFWTMGYVNNSTQYTDFTISTAAGNLTGGTIRVYGLAN